MVGSVWLVWLSLVGLVQFNWLVGFNLIGWLVQFGWFGSVWLVWFSLVGLIQFGWFGWFGWLVWLVGLVQLRSVSLVWFSLVGGFRLYQAFTDNSMTLSISCSCISAVLCWNFVFPPGQNRWSREDLVTSGNRQVVFYCIFLTLFSLFGLPLLLH